MSHRIYLSSLDGNHGVSRGKESLWVHHKSDVVEAERSCVASEFVKEPRKYLEEIEQVVFCNLVSKIIRPGSRLQYGQYTTDPWFGPNRISIDSRLYIEQPWRMWFHFGCVGSRFGDADYQTSYRIQTDWNWHVEEMKENPCSLDVIEKYGKGVVKWVNGFEYKSFSVDVVHLDQSSHERYLVEKEKAFTEEKTTNAILKRMSRFADQEYPFRREPKLDGENVSGILTDLGIDVYLRNLALFHYGLTNGIREAVAC